MSIPPPCLQNASIEYYYPADQYRDDVGLLWYADVSTLDGTLRQLAMAPTRLRCARPACGATLVHAAAAPIGVSPCTTSM